MKTALLLILAFSELLSYSQTDQSCQLTVKVENIKKIKGKIKLAIYDNEQQFLKTEVAWGDQSIQGNSIIYTFKNLKKGVYAISIFQDENENGKLDTNFIGIPTEPYAFSNNAKGLFGPPSFEDCQFELKDGTKSITISL